MRVLVFTDIPSPYQVELFNALAGSRACDVSVVYNRRADSGREWQAAPIIHEHYFLADIEGNQGLHILERCDLAVFCGYRPAKVARLIRLRNRMDKAWAFWGERPGFRFPGWFGRQYRLWAMRELRQSRAPIWGIGAWAIEGYKQELGAKRDFHNVPYTSNLGPFLAIERHFGPLERCRFLFSGSMSARKGVDLLMSAFDRLISDGVDAELHLLGSGPLQHIIEQKRKLHSDRLRIHGFKQWDERVAVYAGSDVLCVPSRYDGWGLVVVEGLASGMPVISTDRTGSARELINPKNGWLLPAGDTDALFSAMQSAAALAPERRRAICDIARKTARMQDVEVGLQRFMRAAETTVRKWNFDPA